MAEEERGIFSPQDISDEIERLNQSSRQVIWDCDGNLSFNLVIPPTVYPPREDTDLIAQQIISLGDGHGRTALEIGCGSGALSILLCAKGWLVSACDINPYAVAASRGNLAVSGFDANIVECGPGSHNRTWLQKKPFDLIIWNLPYLERPAPDTELLGPLEEASLTDLESEGVMELLANNITCDNLLTAEGKALIVHQSDDDVHLICHRWGLAARTKATREFIEGANIQVTCIWHPWSKSPHNRIHTTTSTNEDLLSLELPVGSHLTAEIQTSGRGRMGRHWRSADGCYAGSWVISTGEKVDAGILQLAAGLAVIDALQCFGDMPLQLKWPNDILIGKRKVCGILAESRIKGNDMRAVIGIGINLKKDAEVLTENEASIDEYIELTPEQIDLALHASLASLLEQKPSLPPLDNEGIILRALEHIKSLGDASYRGELCKVHSIADDGKLILTSGDELIEIDDGEAIEWLSLR